MSKFIGENAPFTHHFGIRVQIWEALKPKSDKPLCHMIEFD